MGNERKVGDAAFASVKRFEFGCAAREAWILRRPLMRSPDCGYSRSASSQYISCSASKSFASEAAQCRLSAPRISLSSILLLPFLLTEPKPSSSGQLARGIKPGTPVPTTALNRTLVVMPFRISRMASSGRVETSKFSWM